MTRQNPPREFDRGRITRGPGRVQTCQPPLCADIRLDYLMRIVTGNVLTAAPAMLLISSIPLIFFFLVERTNVRARFVSPGLDVSVLSRCDVGHAGRKQQLKAPSR